MQDLAQCEYSLCNLGVSKKNVDHGAAGAEVLVKTLRILVIYWIFPICDFYYLLQIISKQNLRDAGVIGNARVAELYGLNILECNFQVVIFSLFQHMRYIMMGTFVVVEMFVLRA